MELSTEKRILLHSAIYLAERTMNSGMCPKEETGDFGEGEMSCFPEQINCSLACLDHTLLPALGAKILRGNLKHGADHRKDTFLRISLLTIMGLLMFQFFDMPIQQVAQVNPGQFN